MDKTKGLWIPIEVLQMDLTPVEKMVYAYYLQLSNGEKGAAWGTNEDICEVLGISKPTLKNKTKPSLRKKGLIETSGIRTICIVQNTTPEHLKGDTNGDTNMHLKGDTNEKQIVDTNEHLKGDVECHTKGDGGCHQKGDTKNKEKNNIKLNGVMNKELVIEEKERNNKSTKTEINTTESINKAFHHFFNEGFKGGIYEKVIKDVASSDDHRKTLWERWDIYCKWMKDGKTDISFKKMEQCLNAFLYLIEREYTEPVNIKNKKLKCHHVYNALMKVFFLRQWKRFISNLKMYEPQDCKKTRVAFFDKVVSIYQDDEEREKTVSQMELEYAEAYKATNRNPKLKYEELDPDLKYQNLDETVTPSSTEVEEEVLPFTSTVQAVEKEETKTVSDMFNKVHAEWLKMKREYTKRGDSVPPEDVVKFINKVETMGYLTDYDLKVLHELVQED